jgi:5-methylcytosine-specific restriction endonuclease McrA
MFHQRTGENYKVLIAELDQKHAIWRKEEFLKCHNQYLKSARWKQKREDVLKRDNYLCQACLKAKATEVHHLSYSHWQDEPLFELVSICHECHKIITAIDQNK